jgi:hypothetical protein
MYRPIESVDDLPEPGRANEKRTVDFKVEASDDPFEIAKDVAAFANAEGGTILVGAKGRGEVLASYEPLTTRQASDAQRAYDQAIRDRCRPTPFFDVVALPKDQGLVLAINVSPFPGQLVGVEVKRGEAKCGKAATQPQGLYFFPVRIGAQSTSILPEQMPMFMDAKVRRIAICLQEGIGKPVNMHPARERRGATGVHVHPALIESVDILGNAVRVRLAEVEDAVIAIPFDLIETAWRVEDDFFMSTLGSPREITWSSRVELSQLTKHRWIFDPLGK